MRNDRVSVFPFNVACATRRATNEAIARAEGQLRACAEKSKVHCGAGYNVVGSYSVAPGNVLHKCKYPSNCLVPKYNESTPPRYVAPVSFEQF